MNLVDMRLTKAEQAEEKAEAVYTPSDYSYGLVIRLEQEELDKLGIRMLPKVGAEVRFTCVAKVQSVSTQSTKDDDDACVSLQITQMAIGDDKPAPAKGKTVASALSYSKG